MGRYKLGPQGAYYDPNDSGPDQASPDQIAQLTQGQPPPGYTPPNGNTGINGGNIGNGTIGEKFPGMPPRRPGPWMPQVIDTGNRPPDDWYSRKIDWNDPNSIWGGWTDRNGQPVDPNSRAGGVLGGVIGGLSPLVQQYLQSPQFAANQQQRSSPTLAGLGGVLGGALGKLF